MADWNSLNDQPANLEQVLTDVYTERAAPGMGQSAIYPNLFALSQRAGAGLIAPVARATGTKAGNYLATQVQANAAALEALAEKNAVDTGENPLGARVLRGAGASYLQAKPLAALGGPVRGPYAAVAGAAASTADQGYFEAKRRGMGHQEASQYALEQGTIEAIPAIIFQRAGLGGMEDVLGKGFGNNVRGGILRALKQAGIQTAAELTEEHITEISENINSRLRQVDPGATDAQGLAEAAFSGSTEVTLQTVLSMGLAQGPALTEAAIVGRERAERLAQLKALRSANGSVLKREAAKLGFETEGKSRQDVRGEITLKAKQLEQEIQDEAKAAVNEAPEVRQPEVRQADGVQSQVPESEGEAPQVPVDDDAEFDALLDVGLGAAQKTAAHSETMTPQEIYEAQAKQAEVVPEPPKKSMGKKPPEPLPTAPKPVSAPEPTPVVPVTPAASQEAEKPVKRPVRKPIPAKPPEPAAIPEASDDQLLAMLPDQEAQAKYEAQMRGEKSPDVKLAGEVSAALAAGETIDPKRLHSIAEGAYGGTRAQGAYDPSRANDALELGINLHVTKSKGYNPASGDAAQAKETIKTLEDVVQRTPSHTNRSGLKDVAQQFSTPPAYAYAVNWIANIGKGDTVLEPSAGTGSIAVHAKETGAKVYVNELKEVAGKPNRRAELLNEIGANQVFTEDAEQIHNTLKIKPTVVVMNPPFSTAAGRMEGKKIVGTDLKHIDAAMKLMQPGGRLVAIIGAGLHGKSKTLQDWQDNLPHDLRADIELNRDVYKGYGTTFPTRVLVIDKSPPTGKTLHGKADTLYNLIDQLEGIRNDRISSSQSEPTRTEGETTTRPSGARPRPEPSVRTPARPVVSGGEAAVDSGASGKEERPSDARSGEPASKSEAAKGQQTVPESRLPDTGRPEPGGKSTPGLKDSGTTGTEVGGEPVREPSKPDPKPESSPRVDLESVPLKARQNELSESVYETYSPRRVTVKGSQPHPASVVESAAMAAVDPPKSDYSPNLPSKAIESGALSNIQLEAIIYAGHAHGQEIEVEGKKYRKGFLIGDGTGIGKGRTAAGVILDNWRQGRKKAVWVSKNYGLMTDSKEYSDAVGLPGDKIFSHQKAASGIPFEAKDGILFTTYGTMKGEPSAKALAEGKAKSRLDQMVDWLGEDFDGVIVFDEAHLMGNAVDTKGGRGTKKASAQALAGIELQRRLPQARIVYMSATAATEVSNLAYAERLGLWGKGTAFANQNEFETEIIKGGVAAMEKVAGDMKAMGLYVSRNISFNDGTKKGTVEYERLEHTLTPSEKASYDKMAEAWAVAFNNMNEALKITDGAKNGRAVSAARGAFWGANQRFWNQVITAMQTPAVILAIEKDLADGSSAVIQLTNTNAAATDRALAELDGEQGYEELDTSPRGILMDFVEKSFPVWQQEEYTDDNGNVRMRPALDSQGNPIKNAEAVRMQEQLLDELGSLQVGSRGAVDMIIDHFGADQVAEITGRTMRIVKNKDGKMEKESRGPAKNKADIKTFQEGGKRILVFSEAGGTGASYHADLGRKNQQMRRHYLLQAGWRADVAIQGFGRTHRSNQAQAPSYVLVHTNLKGQKRFISTIARRLAQLGAITKGQRQAVSGGEKALFTAADNLESTEAKQAVIRFYNDVMAGSIPTITLADLQDRLGLKLTDENGNMRNDLPPITQFLNRVLSMPVDEQNAVFGEFEKRLTQQVEMAQARGELDQGIETIRADHIKKLEDRPVYTHESGAETRYVKVNISRKTKPTTWAYLQQNSISIDSFYVRSVKTGKVSAVSPTGTSEIDTKSGDLLHKAKVLDPLGSRYGYAEKLKNEKFYDRLTETEAKAGWDEQVKSAPEFHETEGHYLTGVLLPIWNRIPGENTRVLRMLTDDGEVILGRQIPEDQVQKTLRNLGVSTEAPKLTATEAAHQVMQKNVVLTLANGWSVQRRLVAGEQRMEIVGPSFQHHGELGAADVFWERIQSKTRYFIPVDKAAAVLADVLEGRPITDVIGRSSQQKADEAFQEANDLAAELGNDLGASPTSGFNPKHLAKAAKVVGLYFKAGYYQFEAFLEELGKSYTAEQLAKIRSYFEQAWDDAYASGEFEGMEPRVKPVETTSVKHRKTDEIREKIGMPPRDVSTMTHEEMKAEAERRMKKDPDLAADLAEKVAHKPQVVDGVEHLILSLHIRDLMNRRDAGEDVLGDLVTAVTAARESGREVARSLGSRKVELNPDFTIAGYIQRHLEAFDEQPSAEWLAKYEEMAAQVKEAEEQAREALRELAKEKADAAIAKAKAEKSKPAPKSTGRRQKAEKRLEDALAAFNKAASGLAPSGVPIHLLSPAVEVVKAYVNLGGVRFSEFMETIRKSVKDADEKLFKEAWKQASPLGSNPEPSEIGSFAKKLMRLAVESGIEGRDAVVDVVHQELQAAGLDLSREETMLAMSDYGIYRELAKDDVSVKVREIRGELQQVLKLKDIEAGKIPSLTGVEQRTPSDEENRLRHSVYEGMKKLGLSTQDSTQVTTPLSSKKKAVEKRLGEVDEEIRRLTNNIKQGTPLKADGTRTELVVDEDLIELQSKLDQAYLERDELRKQSPAWQAAETSKAMEKYEESLRRRLELWEGKLSSARRGILPAKRKPSRFEGEFLDAKAKLADVQSETLAEIEKEKRRRWNLGQKIGHGLAEATATIPRELMAGLEMSVVLRQGYFYTHAHPILAFFNVVDSMKSTFSRRYALAQEENLSQRANAKEYEKLDFTLESGPRDHMEEVFQSSTMKWLSKTKKMYLLPARLVAKSYLAFERGFRNFANTMKADLYDIAKRDTLAAREFFSKYDIGKKGWDQEDIDTVSRTANILSGRGTGLKAGAKFVDWLFFARRWVWSRIQAEFILPFQMVTPKFIGQWNADPAMRVAHARLYAQAMVGAAAHMAALYFIMKMLADDDDETDDEPTIEFDPRSSDLAKLKVGETRIDFMGGLPQLATLLTRFLSGTTKTSRGEIRDIRGPDRDYGAPGVFEAVAQALRYKLGPAPSGLFDFFHGKTAVGEELPEEPLRRAAVVVGDRMQPMAYGDMWEAEQELGLKRGTVTAIEAFFGAAVSTHGDKTKFRNADEAGKKKIIFATFGRMDVSMPLRKDFGSDEKFQAAVAKFARDNERAAKDLKSFGVTREEAGDLLREYYRKPDSQGKRGSFLDEDGDPKDSYLGKLRALNLLYE